MHWVEMLPDTQTPSWLGLPSNAEKVLLTTQGMLLLLLLNDSLFFICVPFILNKLRLNILTGQLINQLSLYSSVITRTLAGCRCAVRGRNLRFSCFLRLLWTEHCVPGVKKHVKNIPFPHLSSFHQFSSLFTSQFSEATFCSIAIMCSVAVVIAILL